MLWQESSCVGRRGARNHRAGNNVAVNTHCRRVPTTTQKKGLLKEKIGRGGEEKTRESPFRWEQQGPSLQINARENHLKRAAENESGGATLADVQWDTEKCACLNLISKGAEKPRANFPPNAKKRGGSAVSTSLRF